MIYSGWFNRAFFIVSFFFTVYDQQDEELQYNKIADAEKLGKNPEEFKVKTVGCWFILTVNLFWLYFILFITEHVIFAIGSSGPLLEWFKVSASKLQISRLDQFK